MKCCMQLCVPSKLRADLPAKVVRVALEEAIRAAAKVKATVHVLADPLPVDEETRHPWPRLSHERRKRLHAQRRAQHEEERRLREVVALRNENAAVAVVT